MTINVLVYSNSHHPLLSYVSIINDDPIHTCQAHNRDYISIVKATIRCSYHIYYLCFRMNMRQPTGTPELIFEDNKILTCYLN